MNDVLPDQTAAWQQLERAAREIFAQYGYRELRLPLLERTELFKRSIGEFSDIGMVLLQSGLISRPCLLPVASDLRSPIR